MNRAYPTRPPRATVPLDDFSPDEIHAAAFVSKYLRPKRGGEAFYYVRPNRGTAVGLWTLHAARIITVQALKVEAATRVFLRVDWGNR